MTRSSTSDPLVHDVLGGRYEIVAKLARGGMATVYRALDHRLDRVVAVKVMHDNLGDDTDFASRFDREARAAAKLSDPHVVGVFDQGRDHGRPYIVMEYVEGCTLRNLVTREAPFDPARALALIEPIAAALAAAHGSGLVHRDVKPENVLISRTGQIKVADFGLARAVTSQTITAPRGLVIGTVSYMPPEVVTTGLADARSDVYSTGIMLYELLTGEKPHKGNSPIQVAYSHVNKSVPAPSQTLREHNHAPLPDYLDALVVACTRRDANMRPRNGRDLLARVRRARSAVLAGVDHDDALCAIMNPAAYRVGRSWPEPAAAGTQTDHGLATASVGAATTARAAVMVGPAARTAPSARTAAAVPARAEVRSSDPVAPPSGRWRQLNGPSRPRTPVSPVDMRAAAHPGRPASRPQSQHTPRFPELVNDRVHRRRRGFVAILLVLVLATTIGLTTWSLTDARRVSAPAVVGLTEQQATSAARDAGVTISFEERPDDKVPAGVVISSDPQAGSRIPRKGQMHAQVSTGPQTRAMPVVVGLTRDEAVKALQTAGLGVGTVTEQFDSAHQAAVVTAASADAGSQLAENTGVDLTVSKGPAPVDLADFTGKAATDAQDSLTQAGLQVTTAQQHSGSVPQGQVISQDPAGGQLPVGSTVDLVVSSGPDDVTVPDVRARTTADAHTILEGAGFTVQEVMVDPNAVIRLGRVQRTDPAHGSQAAKGSSVTIYII